MTLLTDPAICFHRNLLLAHNARYDCTIAFARRAFVSQQDYNQRRAPRHPQLRTGSPGSRIIRTRWDDLRRHSAPGYGDPGRQRILMV
jgi:hypothetical protein